MCAQVSRDSIGRCSAGSTDDGARSGRYASRRIPIGPRRRLFIGLQARRRRCHRGVPGRREARRARGGGRAAARTCRYAATSTARPAGGLARRADAGRYDILHVFSNKALQNGLAAARGLPVEDRRVPRHRRQRELLQPGLVAAILESADRPDRLRRATRCATTFSRCAASSCGCRRNGRSPFIKATASNGIRAAPADLRGLGIRRRVRRRMRRELSAAQGYRGARRCARGVAGATGPCTCCSSEHGMDALGSRGGSPPAPSAERIHVLGHRTRRACSDGGVRRCSRCRRSSAKGFARSLIEAMAYGVAPVVTDCGGSPELVVDGERAAWSFRWATRAPSRAPIGRLYQDGSCAARLGAAARGRGSRTTSASRTRSPRRWRFTVIWSLRG